MTKYVEDGDKSTEPVVDPTDPEVPETNSDSKSQSKTTTTTTTRAPKGDNLIELWLDFYPISYKMHNGIPIGVEIRCPHHEKTAAGTWCKKHIYRLAEGMTTEESVLRLKFWMWKGLRIDESQRKDHVKIDISTQSGEFFPSEDEIDMLMLDELKKYPPTRGGMPSGV